MPLSNTMNISIRMNAVSCDKQPGLPFVRLNGHAVLTGGITISEYITTHLNHPVLKDQNEHHSPPICRRRLHPTDAESKGVCHVAREDNKQATWTDRHSLSLFTPSLTVKAAEAEALGACVGRILHHHLNSDPEPKRRSQATARGSNFP
jgi:hypothetical protein